MRKPMVPRVSPIAGVGLVALVVFGAGIAAYLLSDRFDAWAPNAATEAISVFVTVVVVGWLLRREAERRIRPRREDALESVDHTLHLLVTSIAGDYIETHPFRAANVAPNLKAILDLCADSLAAGDEEAPRRYYDGALRIVDAARQCARSFDQIRREDADVLSPRLNVALRELARGLRSANTLFTMVGPPSDESGGRTIDRDIAEEVVKAARSFFDVYRAETGADISLTEGDRWMLNGIAIMARQHAP